MIAPEYPPGFVGVSGFPYYCISEYGVVLSCRTRGGKFVPWTPMKQTLNRLDSRGRLFVGFRNGRKAPHPRAIHTLVLTHFLGPCPDGMEGCHNDGNPLNNHISNLRWDTHVNNMADRELHGRTPKGERNGAAKLTETQVREILELKDQGVMQKDAAPMFGVSKQCIQLIYDRKTWPDLVK